MCLGVSVIPSPTFCRVELSIFLLPEVICVWIEDTDELLLVFSVDEQTHSTSLGVLSLDDEDDDGRLFVNETRSLEYFSGKCVNGVVGTGSTRSFDGNIGKLYTFSIKPGVPISPCRFGVPNVAATALRDISAASL